MRPSGGSERRACCNLEGQCADFNRTLDRHRVATARLGGAPSAKGCFPKKIKDRKKKTGLKFHWKQLGRMIKRKGTQEVRTRLQGVSKAWPDLLSEREKRES